MVTHGSQWWPKSLKLTHQLGHWTLKLVLPLMKTTGEYLMIWQMNYENLVCWGLTTIPAPGNVYYSPVNNAINFETVKKHGDTGMLPLECPYLNKTALFTVVGQQVILLLHVWNYLTHQHLFFCSRFLSNILHWSENQSQQLCEPSCFRSQQMHKIIWKRIQHQQFP